MSVLIADLECDSLKPSVIHMIGVVDWATDEFTDYHGDEIADGLLRLEAADKVIMFNGRGYDVPVIERLTNGLVHIGEDKLIEVLDLSRRYAELPNHKLATWGELFDFPKGDYHDFSRYTTAMSVYCERDCRLTKKVFDLLNEMAMERGRQDLLEDFR